MSLGTISLIRAAGANPSTPTYVDRISFLGDSAYPTGGSPGFAALFRAKTLDQRGPVAVILESCSGSTKYDVNYDVAADKLVVTSGNAEVSNATDLSAVTFKLVVVSQ